MKILVLLTLCCIACGGDDVTLDASSDLDAGLVDGGSHASTDAAGHDGGRPDATDAGVDSCHSIRNLTDLAPMLDDARCEDGVAVVCDSDTSTWEHTTCGAGTRCETYPVTIYENIGDEEDAEYVAAFDTVGADCIPEGADACTWTVDAGGRSTTEFEDRCTDDLQRECRRAAVESVYITRNGGFASTERGWVLDTPCADDESCRGQYCVEDDLVSCDSFDFESTCTGDVLHTCLSGDPFDYEADVDCAARGGTCESTCAGGASCIDPGRDPCDPETFVPVCAGADELTTCQFDCYTRTVECGEQFYQGSVVDTYCGTAYDVYRGRPEAASDTCLPEGAPTCVPSTFVERCEGDTTVTCDGLVRRIACPAGQECTLVDGNAGCAVPDSPACTAGVISCEGDLLVGCCETGSDWVDRTHRFWCQPGLQYVRQDCRAFGGTCYEDSTFGFTECR